MMAKAALCGRKPKHDKLGASDNIISLQKHRCTGRVGSMDKRPTIRDLYPNLSQAELRETENNLEQYLLIVLRIYERISTDPESYTQLRALTTKTGTLSCTPPRSKLLGGVNGNSQT